jgi:iron complex transport system ATP-binding protein
MVPGKVTAVLGPNGAGKSTLLKLLLGVLTPTGGRASWEGRDLHRVPARERAAAIAYVPQKSQVAFAFSVREVVALGRYGAGRSSDGAIIERAMRSVEILDRADEPFGILSAGQQQRATVARALAQIEPLDGPPARVVLADEPVSAMDPAHAIATMELLASLSRRGVTVVVVLHDLSLAMRFADSALLIGGDGAVAAFGPSDQVLTPAVLERVYSVPFVELVESATGVRAGLSPRIAHRPG